MVMNNEREKEMKKMKKQLKLAAYSVTAMLVLGVVGCGGPNPAKVSQMCVDRLRKADFAGMRQFAADDMMARLDRAEYRYIEVTRLLGEKKAAKFKKTYDKLKYEIGDVSSGDTKVTVPIKINGQDTPMILIKSGGKWRVEKFDFPII